MNKYLLCGILLFGLSACAGAPEPKPDRVQKVTEFVVFPDDKLRCPGEPQLSKEQIDAIETETDLVEQYMLPFVENMDECQAKLQDLREINEFHKSENEKLSNN